VVCTGIEEKMGIHASSTCSMTLGGKGKCRGWLLGEERQGMKIMFYMMNEARLGEVALHIGKSALSPRIKVAFAHAFPFLEVMGDAVMAWMLLWRAALAKQKLENGARKKDVDFYEGQVKTAEFFIQTILPTTMGKMNSIIKSNVSAIEISKAAFGG